MVNLLMPLWKKVALLQKHEILPSENVRFFAERIEKIDKEINSFIYVNVDAALEQAKQLEALPREEREKMPLYGLVAGIKSNINVQGFLTSCASKTLENYYAPYDADVVSKLKRAGAIIIGMLNMDEFAAGSSGETSYFGPTKNPLDLNKIPGGSSSGSAAAVSAGLVDFSLGSDTGGSIRNPASHCGVVGVKPTYGLVSRHGLIDLAMSLDQIGPLTRHVKDNALVLQVIAGHSENDPTTLQVPIPDLSNYSEPKAMRVGYLKQFESMVSDKRILEKVKEVVEKFVDVTGSELIEIEIPHIDLAVQTYYPLVYAEFFSATRRFDGRKYGYVIEEVCGEEVLRRIIGGKLLTKAELSGKYYRKALATRKLIEQEFRKVFEQVDVILAPVVPKLPHTLGEKIGPLDMYAYDAFTIPANLAGIPAGSVPIAKIDGVAIGLQVMAKTLGEKTMYCVMDKIESLVNFKLED